MDKNVSKQSLCSCICLLRFCCMIVFFAFCSRWIHNSKVLQNSLLLKKKTLQNKSYFLWQSLVMGILQALRFSPMGEIHLEKSIGDSQKRKTTFSLTSAVQLVPWNFVYTVYFKPQSFTPSLFLFENIQALYYCGCCSVGVCLPRMPVVDCSSPGFEGILTCRKWQFQRSLDFKTDYPSQ